MKAVIYAGNGWIAKHGITEKGAILAKLKFIEFLKKSKQLIYLEVNALIADGNRKLFMK